MTQPTLFRSMARAWVTALVCLGHLTLAAAEVSEDWPQFLGPRGDNSSSETGLLQRWPTNGLRLLWERSIGSGYSAPSVLNSNLVAHHRIQDQEIVETIDAATGGTVWRYAYRSDFSDPYGYNSGPRSTPLLASNRCYTLGAEGRLMCLDLKSGQMLWEHDTAREWKVPKAFFGVGSSPVLANGKLFVMVGGQPHAAVVAFDPENGRVLWEGGGRDAWQGAPTVGWPDESPYQWTGTEKLASYSTPVVATPHGQLHLLCLTRQGLISLDPDTGRARFRRWFQSPVDESVNAMCPVVHDDRVLISAAYYRIGSVLLGVEPGGNSFREVWRSPDRKGSSTGQPASAPVLEAHWSTPVFHKGYLYSFSGRNESDALLRCVEFDTGRLAWSRDERWRAHSTRQPRAYGRGSLILAEGKLIVLGEGGRLGLFNLNPRQPEELSSWQVPQLHYPCWTGPVLAGGRLYLRSENSLLCFALKERLGK